MTTPDRKRSLAIALRKWLGARSLSRGVGALSSETGIREETLLKYFKGRAFPREENLNKLLLVPELEPLARLAENSLPLEEAGQKREHKSRQPPQAAHKKENLEERAKEAGKLLSALSAALAPIEGGGAECRKAFRKALSNSDLEPLVARLKALLHDGPSRNRPNPSAHAVKGKEKDED